MVQSEDTGQNAIDWRGIHVTDYGIYPSSQYAGRWIPGTLSYWAPEIKIANAIPTAESDMWALGCIAYEMCVGLQLSHGNTRAPIDAVALGGFLDLSRIPQRFDEGVRYVIGNLLRFHPGERATAQQLKEYLEQNF